MKILVTGANGLLGQKLVALLLPRPEVVLLATGRGPNRLAPWFPALRYRPLDVTDAAQVRQVLADERPDHLIHAAAMTQVDDCELNPEDCWLHNVTATQRLATACAELGIHFIHLSTDFIFNGEHGPLTEEAQPDPLSYYGHSKLAAEQAVQATPGLRWAIARTVLVYGTVLGGGRSNLVQWVRDSLGKGQAIKVVDDQYRTPTLAEDLALGCYLLAQYQATGIYHLSGPDLLTPFQMARQVAAYFRLDERLLTRVDASTFSQPGRRPARTGFVIDKARRELGFWPCTFAEGIAVLAGQLA